MVMLRRTHRPFVVSMSPFVAVALASCDVSDRQVHVDPGNGAAARDATGNDVHTDAAFGGANSGGASVAGATGSGGSGGRVTAKGGASGSLGPGGSGDAGKGGEDAGVGPGGATSSGGTSGGAAGDSGVGGCTQNECGGCTPLTAHVGDPCIPCGTQACSGQDALVCKSGCSGANPACKSATNACVACVVDTYCKQAAAPVCLNNKCVECKPGATGCVGTTTTPRSCDNGGNWVNGTVTSGTCGATCNPGALRCISGLAQQCSADGKSWPAAGTSTNCACVAPTGRFVKTAADRVLDTTSGLTWDYPGHTAANYATASAKCTSQGMRLPTRNDWKTVVLASVTQTNSCIPSSSIYIDSVAFPGVVVNAAQWTDDISTYDPGYLFTLSFSAGGGTLLLDRQQGLTGPYQCVSGP